MPQVPNLESPSVQEEPLPGRPFPRLDDSVSPAAFGAPLAAGIEDVSSAVTSEEAKQKVQNDNLRIIDANTQLEAGRNALLYGQPDPKTGQMTGGAFSYHGMDAINLPGKMLPAYQQLAQNISSTLTPDQQRIFQTHIASGQNELNVQLNRYEYEESNRLAQQTFTSAANQAIDSASLAWRDPIQLGKSRADIKALVELQGQREGWPQELKDEKARDLLGAMHENVIQSMLDDQNAQGAKAYLDEHRSEIQPKEAMALTKTVQEYQVQQTANGILKSFSTDAQLGSKQLEAVSKSDLPPEQQSQVIQAVEKGRSDLAQARQQDPANRSQLTALTDGIAGGTTSPTDLSTIDSLWRKAVLTDDQHTSLRDQVIRAQKAGKDKQSDLEFARDAFNNRTPLDPKDPDQKRPVNLLLAMTTMGQPAGSDAYNNAAVAITDHVGIVPEGAISFARASLVGGDPQKAAQASQLMMSLQRVNPRAYTEATDEGTRAMADTIGNAVAAGTDPKAAVEMARENAERSKSAQSFLNDQWNRQRSPGQRWDQIDASAIRSGLADDPLYKESGLHLSNTVPQPPNAMLGEYASLSREYFNHTGGNLQQAQQLALNDLKSTWGISEVNGSRELMKYAPERMVPGLTADMVHQDLADSGHADAHLTESVNTGTSGGKEWNLSEKDQFGAYDVVRDKNGMPLRYHLPDVKQASEEAGQKQAVTDRANLQKEQHFNEVMTEVREQKDNSVGLE